jgi:hypothetical protein
MRDRFPNDHDGLPGKRWEVLAELGMRFDLKAFAEIGVKSGRTSGELLTRLPEATLICVDPWAPYDDWPSWDQHKHSRNERGFDKIAKQFGPRITKLKMPSVVAARRIPDKSLDCVFIDADHSYLAVVADIDAWLPKVRPGGILSGHDYNNTAKYGNRFKGVDRAVDERFGDRAKIESDSVWWVRV